MRFEPLTLLALGGSINPALGLRVPRNQGGWNLLAPIPIAPRQEHTTVALSDTTLAILGGIVPSGDSVTTTDMMQLYDIPTDAWRSAADIPMPLNHANAAVVNGKIYLLGGLAVLANGTWSAVPNSWVYDPEDDKWTPLTAMPNGAGRGSAAMGVYEDTIYVAGGMTILVPGGYQNSITTVLAFNTTSGTWTSVPEAAKNIPEGRDHSASAVIDSTFYILGGRNFGQYNGRGTVFSLNLESPTEGWRTSAKSMPTPRGGISAGTIGKSVYIFGGEGNMAEGSDGVFNETEVFNSETERWNKLAPMKLPRHGTSAVAIGGRVYIPGGGVRVGGAPVSYTDAFYPLHA
ncbi:Fc.00g072560.m01.CDS01 [Cosmosporella sp. VM-42]